MKTQDTNFNPKMSSEGQELSGNELIAEFMGGSLEKRDFITIGGKRTGKWTFPDRTWCYDDQLQYSKRWDWLMPVVEKIDSLGIDHPEAYALQEYTIFAKIDVVYQAVVEFIKWHKTQTP